LSRIADTLARAKSEGRTALVAYVTAGYPDARSSPGLVRALVDGGADVVELGVPFSDPLADGATIQRANTVALGQGVNLRWCLGAVKELRKGGLEVPLLLMGYYNPISAYGPEVFVADAADAGVDGLIVVDLPPEESAALREACRGHGLDLVYLLAPTSGPERIALVSRWASGFIYCVSVAGVTGARAALPSDLAAFVERVRAGTTLPLAVGFGISRREHVEAVGRLADAAAVGSAIIDVIDASDVSEREARVREYVEVLAGRRRAAVHGRDR
jgi:tryptophan synthase alpha chain